MRLIIIDPGMRGAHGHHLVLNEMIETECRRRGIQVEVWASRRADDGVIRRFSATPLFRHGPYSQFERQSDYDLLRTVALSSTVTEQDLSQAPRVPEPGDRLLVHTISLRQLFGLYGWFRRLPAPRPHLTILFRFPPWYFLPAQDRDVAVALHAHAFRLWRTLPAGEVAFATDSRNLAGLLQADWPHPITVMPIPLALPDETSTGLPEGLPQRPLQMEAGRDRTELNLLYAGDARPEKGFDLLMGALKPLLARHPHLRFTIQCANATQDERDMLRSRLAGLPGRVRLLLEPLPLADYHRLVEGADALLVAYDPDQYTYRTSHVFVDALAFGKPVVYTAGSWMDGEAAELTPRVGPVGARMPAFTTAALVAAVEELLANFGTFVAGVRRARPAWRTRHNVVAFLNDFEGIPGGGRGESVRP